MVIASNERSGNSQIWISSGKSQPSIDDLHPNAWLKEHCRVGMIRDVGNRLFMRTSMETAT